MLTHVALAAYLVLSACLATGELRSSSTVLVPTSLVQSVTTGVSPVNQTEAKAPAVSTESQGTSTTDGDVVASPAVHRRSAKVQPQIQPANARGSNSRPNTAQVGGGPTPNPSPVPEPQIFALVGIGLLMLAMLRRRVARSES